MPDDRLPVARAAVTTTRMVRLPAGAPAESREDQLAVEEPIEIRIGGTPTTVIMRTPGHDEELARGFLFTEGLIHRAEDLLSVTRPAAEKPEEVGNLLDVEVAPPLVTRKPFSSNFYASSSCGVCGKSSLAAIEVHAKPVTSEARWSRALIATFPDQLRAAQSLFDATGGLHAAALLDKNGDLVVVREDVGRHNAVDKTIGWALAAGRLPASQLALQVSGRTSFEILQKAIMAGVPLVCAVSAPSSLAVALAEKFGVTLVGFLRAGSMNVYAHPHRVID